MRANTTRTAQKPETPAIPRTRSASNAAAKPGTAAVGAEDGQDEDEHTDEDRRGQTDAVVVVDALVELEQSRCGAAAGSEPSASSRRGRWHDVHDRDEAGDPSRVRCEDALESGADDEDRVARAFGWRPPSGSPT